MTTIYYHWPVPGVRPEFPWGRYPSGGYHPAYDFGVPTGTPVHAPAGGTILATTFDAAGYGIHVRIRHSNGHMSILAHLETKLWSPGSYVRQDDVVGYSDNTGHSSGPHLHWETRTSVTGLQRDTAYDPGPYIRLGLNESPPDPAYPTSPSAPGGPQPPFDGWSTGEPGIFIDPALQTIAGGDFFTEPRFSPAIVS